VDAFPELDLDPDTFQAECQSRLISWLTNLAALTKDNLEELFKPVPADSPAIPVLWDKMVPRKVSEDELLAAQDAWGSETMDRQVLKLAMIDPNSTDENVRRAIDHLRALFWGYAIRNKLLPIGDDKARMFFMQDSNYAGVCPRTYVGKQQDEDSEDLSGMPRYSPRFWQWDEGAEEKRRIGRLFGREGTCRLVTTRVIDLVGFPDAPHSGRMSYICFFLGSDYRRISIWGDSVADISKEYPEFAERLQRRVLDAELFHEEHGTLGSLKFLKERLSAVGALPSDLECLNSLDRKHIAQEAAIAAASAAFTRGDQSAFKIAYLDCMSIARVRQAIGRVVHSTGTGNVPEPEPSLAKIALADLLFSSSSYSGIRPFVN
jgi:hypothetical protein